MSKIRQISKKVADSDSAAESPAQAVATEAEPAGMSYQIAVNNVVAVVRAYACNADQRDILNQSLTVIAQGLNAASTAAARIEELTAELEMLKTAESEEASA